MQPFLTRSYKFSKFNFSPSANDYSNVFYYFINTLKIREVRSYYKVRYVANNTEQKYGTLWGVSPIITLS